MKTLTKIIIALSIIGAVSCFACNNWAGGFWAINTALTNVTVLQLRNRD